MSSNDRVRVTGDSAVGAVADTGVRTQPPAGRRRTIVQILHSHGSVSIAELERELGVSGMTIRRDLRSLEKEGLAARTYGGAVLPAATAVEGSFDQRMTEDVESKARLSRATLDLISDGETIFVDSSTAAFFASRVLIAAGRKITIVTNSLPVLELVRRSSAVGAIALGGRYQAEGARFTGPDTMRAASALLADRLLLSTTGLTSDGLLSDADALEAELKRTLVERANESILLITAADLRRRGLGIFGSLKDVTLVLHTHDISEADASRLGALAPEVRRV